MDLSLESALSAEATGNERPGQLAGRSLEEWNDAYSKVESYLHALRVQNKVLLGRLVIHVLKNAMSRALHETHRSATELAAEELDRLVSNWFGEILSESPTGADHRLSTRGRLALLLADMPGKWQDQFLRPGPWPEEFVSAMRETYLRAGPNFQLSQMTPRPLDLGAVSTLTMIGRLPYSRMILVWGLLVVILVALFLITHPSLN